MNDTISREQITAAVADFGQESANDNSTVASQARSIADTIHNSGEATDEIHTSTNTQVDTYTGGGAPGTLNINLKDLDAELPTDVRHLMRGFKMLNGLLERLRLSKSKEERAELNVAIKKTKARLYSLQQIPEIEVDLQAERIARGRAINAREETRNNRIDRLGAALASGEFLPILPEKDLPSVLLDFLAEAETIQEIVDLRHSLALYELSCLWDWIYLNPQGRLDEHRFAISFRANPSSETMAQIEREAATISGQHFRAIASTKAAALGKMFRETIRPRLLLLLDSAIIFVMRAKLAAIDAEKAFFSSHGVDWRETPVSTQFNETIDLLKHHKNALTNPAAASVGPLVPTVPSVETTALQSVFGLAILPPVDAAALK